MAEQGQKVVLGLVRFFGGDLGRLQFLFRTLALGDISKTPDPADAAIIDRLDFRISLENSSVSKLQNIKALRWPRRVNLFDPGQELLAVLEFSAEQFPQLLDVGRIYNLAG